MGQKVNPILFRITGGTSEWFCDWYAKDKKTYANNVFEDLVIIQYLEKSEFSQYIGDVKVERKSSVPHVIIKTPRSAAIISKKGKGLETIQSDLKKLLKKEVSLSIVDIKRQDLNPRVVGSNIIKQIEKRIPYKKAVKNAIESTMRAGALGVKVSCGGRLNGAEIARSETFREGAMPLHSIRANIDYAMCEAKTTYGIIGVKIWIYVSGFGSSRGGK